MKIIRPAGVSEDELVSSSVADADPVWAAPTTYALGAVVTYERRRWESLVASNIGHVPSAPGSTKWLELGPSNRWAMFDQVNGTQTTASDEISVTVSTSARIDSLALLNVSAAEVTVVAETAGGSPVYDQTFSLIDNDEIVDWHEYFFADVRRKTELIISGLPRYSGMDISVTLSIPGELVAVGAMIIGAGQHLGMTLAGARIGIIDYSRKGADDFGNYTLVERAFSRRGNFTVVVEGVSENDIASKVDDVARILSDYRASPLVWVGSEAYGATTIFGFYRSFEVDIAYPTHSILSLEIEGLT